MISELVVMRVVHILAGVIWAGSAIFLAVVLDPRLRALGPDIQRKVTAALAPGLRIVLDAGAAITILAGIALIIRLERDLLDASGWAWAILTGFAASILALASGIATISTMKKLTGTGEDMTGGDPTLEEEAEAGRLSARATLLARITAVLVVVAVVTMASARFVG